MRVDPFDRVVMRQYPPQDPEGPLNLFDFMRGGEVEPHAWITPPYYNVLFQYLTPSNDAPTDDGTDQPVRAAQADVDDFPDLMVVRGKVTVDGKAEFYPFYRVPANDENRKLVLKTPRQGTHEIRFFRGDDEVREARIAWTPDFRVSRDAEQDTLPSRPFTWFVKPLDGVTRVELRVRGEKASTLSVQNQPPRIQNVTRAAVANALNAGNERRQIRLQWSMVQRAENAEGAGNAERAGNAESPLLHQVYYSADDGKSWQLVASGLKESTSVVNIDSLPGGEKCRFQVRTTDGYNVSVIDGETFSMESSPPRMQILAPKTGQVYKQGAGVLLVGSGFDLKTKRLDSKSLEWTSNQQGLLGTGEKLVIRSLQPGKHVITS